MHRLRGQLYSEIHSQCAVRAREYLLPYLLYFWQLLTSQIPYPHRTRDVQVMKDMQNNVKPPGPADVALISSGPRVGALLDSCWSFDPIARPSMTQVRADLESICIARGMHR
jgi:hypothetical protein